MKSYDIIIIGAGPAGCAAALSLRDSGLRVALCEREVFPREKICGDGLCDRSINTLRAISDSYYKEFLSELNPLKINKALVYYKNKCHTRGLKSFGYTLKRRDFDQFLFTRVTRDCHNLEVFEKCKINDVKRSGEEMDVISSHLSLKTKFLIFANGVHSSPANDFPGTNRKKEDNGFAIRSYFKGIQGLQDDGIEMHYKKEYFPGYFWIFPMGNGLANAGFGYHLKHANRFSLSVKDIFQHWINTDLKHRFVNAEQVAPLKGGLIPYSTNKYQCYGNNYAITGDSASLADPISAGGIGNAMFSGREAALQAIRCFNRNDFSDKITKDYAFALKKRMQREMARRHLMQKTVSNHRWLMDVVALFA